MNQSKATKSRLPLLGCRSQTQKLCMCIILVYVLLLHPSFALLCFWMFTRGGGSSKLYNNRFTLFSTSIHPWGWLVSAFRVVFIYIYIPKLSSIFFWVSLIGDIRQVTLSLGHSLTLSLPTSSPVLSVAAN
jgi:hypothetical protein